MSLPYFFIQTVPSGRLITLDEANSRHAVQVLRMQAGEKLNLTDGKGNLFTARITEPHKRNCTAEITESSFTPKAGKQVCIAVSPVKNNSRFEWFLEKAQELGVSEVVPLLCKRTEKQHLKFERLQGILISAMLQSQQVWLTQLSDAVKFSDFVSCARKESRLIAHCAEDQKTSLVQIVHGMNTSAEKNQRSTILIGPEGDFTEEEIGLARENKFQPVSLGETRLRTETAAIAASVLLTN